MTLHQRVEKRGYFLTDVSSTLGRGTAAPLGCVNFEVKPETRKIRDESFGKVSGQSFALVLRFRIFIIRETDMTSAEAHARKRLKMKAFSETTATCYPEPHSEDGFSVVFFGNRAVKSTRAVGPVVAETTVTLAIRIQGLSVLDVATPRTNPASPIRLRQTLRFRFFFFFLLHVLSRSGDTAGGHVACESRDCLLEASYGKR